MANSPRPCILIFRIGSIGDTVVALPCFHALARRYSTHRRVLLTNAAFQVRASSAESVLTGTGLIDETLYYPVGDFSLAAFRVLAAEIRRCRPELLVYLAERFTLGPVLRDVAIFKAAGVPRIVGLPWTARARRGECLAGTQELEQETYRLARLLEPFAPVEFGAADWDLKLSALEIQRADQVLSGLGAAAIAGGVIAVAPGAKFAVKDWGAHNWGALLDSLTASYPSLALVLIGAGDERALADDVAREWRGPRVNLCGSLTPRETTAVLRRCALLICHDSGPMHLAATQGIPCVALFGNYNKPRQWYPFGAGHRVVHEPRGVRAIEVARVAGEVRAALDERPLVKVRATP
jgi:ADP-heptose:LPS heptosyltransferase